VLTKFDRIAVFDFDNTLSTKSSTIPFLRHLHKHDFFFQFIQVLPTALLFQTKFLGIDDLNTAFVRQFIKGLSKKQLLTFAESFNKHYMPNILNTIAMQRLQWHKKKLDFCLLATSAYNVYIDAWAAQHGFDAVVSTKIEFDNKDLATGKLERPSCYGKEKLKRVRELIGQKEITYAYGDSKGDKQILEVAKNAYYRKFE